jgi:beta-phosphoglucomutase-like phosphatase (HAD superfamily)
MKIEDRVKMVVVNFKAVVFDADGVVVRSNTFFVARVFDTKLRETVMLYRLFLRPKGVATARNLWG